MQGSLGFQWKWRLPSYSYSVWNNFVNSLSQIEETFYCCANYILKKRYALPKVDNRTTGQQANRTPGSHCGLSNHMFMGVLYINL